MMKIRSLLIILVTLLLAWLLPMLSGMFHSQSSRRLMIYFSSISQHFCVVERDVNNDIVRKDVQTNEHYRLNQFDSILPLLYYRQLLADGKMPQTIQGHSISAKDANEKSFFFKYRPKAKNSPQIELYPLFESVSGRVDLLMPNDLFRLNNQLDFISPEKNKIDTIKTQQFRKVFNEKGFAFPAKRVAGNPSPRKPYDEGWFLIDAADKLFHFKMIKNKPFLKQIILPNAVKPDYFMPHEPDDRSFYGFLVDKKGLLYVLNTDSYSLQRIDCGSVNLDTHIMSIMGNPLYWTVRLIAKNDESVFAFDAISKKLIDKHHFPAETKTRQWETYLFPFQLTWTTSLSSYIKPHFAFGDSFVLLLNALLALCLFLLIRRKKDMKCSLFASFWVFLTGVFGFLAILLLGEKDR